MKVGDLVFYCYYGGDIKLRIIEAYDQFGNIVVHEISKDKLRQGLGIVLDNLPEYGGTTCPFAYVKWLSTPEILKQSYEKGRIKSVNFVAINLLGTL